ncbi:2-oxoglutarate (2OG) and Fe(II)-dependent oxygenase superfamily protein [Hibiscus syriacus]|uniref:2-oxoglutarate (2OG) and Fe(II)-dependent oxygenase superfamily protein n=1 Tax=Hibiscus syriacus TaxID=106335 RepID=A0A6A3AF06_HIBSY|nr:2-oxoglutarate (2OG) and Fe(II)-dependent oxygenase superfamily protein [Hibiscus syriacus]
MGEVDEDFIQAAEHRPKLDTIEIEGIPLIDLSVSDIKVKRDEVNAMGYHEGEHTKNVRDRKEVFDFLIKDPSFLPASPEPEDKQTRTLSNQWPENPLEFREVCEEYAGEVEKLGYKLLELISLSLSLPSNRYHTYFEDHMTMMRFNHYPPYPCPELALGIGRHKDAGALTIVAQDYDGGLQVWSNEAYESVEHRVVVNSEKERFFDSGLLFPFSLRHGEAIGGTHG